MSSELAIEAEGLVKVFGETRAVDGIDLAVRRGTVYGVLGPNGAGKTTTIRMLATLLHPDGGRRGCSATTSSREADAVRASVSLTGQFASVDEELTGRENLMLLGRLLGLGTAGRDARADELLDAFGLTDAADKLVSDYSGGMRRRLDIAASIVVTPELLFLDEPTTGLDPRSRNQVWDIVRVLVAEGTTVLLTTQYLDEADQLAERIAIIDHGRVIAEGTRGELKALVGAGRAARPRARPRPARTRRPRPRRVARRRGPARVRPGRAVGRRRRHRPGRGRPGRAGRAPASPSPSSRSASPASTRCSSPSPAIPADATAEEEDGMTATTTVAEPVITEDALRAALADHARARRAVARSSASLTFGWRAMLKIKHVPMQLFDVTAFPIMFVLLYTYLFGGALAGSPREYLQELLPGDPRHDRHVDHDVHGHGASTRTSDKGVFDRFRSLPIWRPAVLVGMLLADAVRYTIASPS